MNKRQKEVQQVFLDEEKTALKKLEKNYEDALAEIDRKLEILMARQDADMSHVIYQIEHQRALRTQVQSILENLQAKEFDSISEYLANAYINGFVGTMYDIHGQGVPLIVPIDQKKVLEAIKHETKLSENLYTSLGHDIKDLQKKIAGEISRGISSGIGYAEIARNIASQANIPKNRAMTIARTESHRIQCKATADAQYEAKAKGADVVKQWDSTLDGVTRENHRILDGQIKELEEPFSVGKYKPRYPGDFGDPAEDCNCRCALLQRARWNLGKEELDTLKERAEFFGLDKSEEFADFEKKYIKAAEQLENSGKSSKIKLTDTQVKTIHDYMSAKSYVVNEKLRTGATLSPDEQEFVKNLDNTLDKIQSYEGNLQRSLFFYSNEAIEEFVNRHAVGNKVTYDEYLSTTKGKTYNPDGQVQIYIQDAKKGKDISLLNDEEDEVLYKRNSSFIVENVVEQDGKYYILVVEDNE